MTHTKYNDVSNEGESSGDSYFEAWLLTGTRIFRDIHRDILCLVYGDSHVRIYGNIYGNVYGEVDSET